MSNLDPLTLIYVAALEVLVMQPSRQFTIIKEIMIGFCVGSELVRIIKLVRMTAQSNTKLELVVQDL